MCQTDAWSFSAHIYPFFQLAEGTTVVKIILPNKGWLSVSTDYRLAALMSRITNTLFKQIRPLAKDYLVSVQFAY